ncbi:hypothetical protein CBS63078_8427 [Aspergillus niger]|uniref:Aldo/keto reductase family protein n=1 Tax=Aspergillus niger TaxID=5061 RepID=A0A254UB19_ASPNG|nr:hypothetical protein CBS133816_8254 [Aspergillus niger]KAI2849234.1 hypothetical protein CBS11350_2386 [Aspergillus niger]KAI2851526.1 hypothetical protein CBS12448_8461 [Aspergillus niger]KAI2891594.1 hypothetical protein CBS11852_5993 [Aspergillus niger]KAI2895913.1 hypothetical protein CBS63078_8427 [Aspergillus niger]
MESLPKGLLTTATKVSTELDGVGPVHIGDVVQLWKVYSANPSAHDDDVGYRLENFFWRIWGSHCLNHTLLGSTLASLFLRISEPNPFSLVQLSKAAKAAQSSKGNREGPSGRPGVNNGKAPLHPILKKPRNGSSSGETHKTTRLLLTGIDGQSTTRKPSNPPTPVPPPVPTMGDTAPRQTQKKAIFVASKAKSSKRRPVIMRRKSSQQSSGTSSTRAQSPPPDPPQLTLDYAQSPQIQASGSASKATVDAYELIETMPLSRSHGEPRSDLAVSPRDTKNELPGKGLFIEDVLEKDPAEEERAQVERSPELPELFLSDLRELLDTERPEVAYVKPPPPRRRAFYSVEPSLPEPNFFSATGCRRYDARYLSAENYEQPSSMKLVDKNFRKQFSDRVRREQVLVSSLGSPEPETEPKAILPKPVRAESSSTVTNDTSPSRFGDSHGKASTAPSSAVPFQRPSNYEDSFSTDSQGSTEEEVPPVLTTFTMPRRQSQLSVMIEQSRQQGVEEGQQETEEVIEEIRE